MQPSHVAGVWLARLLTAKSSVTELCLADNELGLGGKGAMLAMRKAGSDVQGVNGQCGETKMAFIFPVFTSVAQTAKRPALAQGATRKDVDVGFLFNSYPSKGAKPPQKNNPKTYRYIVIKGHWVSRVFASCMSLQISGFRFSEWTWDQWPLSRFNYCSIVEINK